MKPLKTRHVRFPGEGTVTITNYRLVVEGVRVRIQTELRTWPEGDPEFRVDFWTPRTRFKTGGSQHWENPVGAFRAISGAIQSLYEGQIGHARLMVYAADESRLRVYRRCLERVIARRGSGHINDQIRDGDFQGMEYVY